MYVILNNLTIIANIDSMNFSTSISPKIIENIEKQYAKSDLPSLSIGDTVKVYLLIKEGNKERVQVNQGVIIAKNNSQLTSTITVRSNLQGVGVERVYLVHSPLIKNIEVLRRSKVRRAKLYYLRGLSGKATRLKQRFN
uniref:50S ribosomal protein L19 n=2 Tax=Porphyridium purpureum TaxID=35688 RepID=A0A343KNY1_PORPP|nr:50S ribosomal protein L19 [Porphyridium purpureum]